MSFSQDVKEEIAGKKKNLRPCCARAACYAVACFSKYFDARGVVLQTELESVANYARKLYHLCGINGTIEVKARASGSIYEFSVKEPEEVKKLLTLFGHTGNETTLRIHPENFSCPACYSTFVSMAFLCSGTITDPAKGYNLEFFTPKHNLARDFEGILAEHEFQPHRTIRKGANVIYIKASERIENLLAYMGAGKGSMAIMNSRLFKDMRNRTNRLSNCDTANISKSVQAAVQVQKAIRYLEEQGKLESLPPQLYEAACMRRKYPGYTLAQLAVAFEPPISKSGLSHRMKKLEELAKSMQENNTDVGSSQ